MPKPKMKPSAKRHAVPEDNQAAAEALAYAEASRNAKKAMIEEEIVAQKPMTVARVAVLLLHQKRNNKTTSLTQIAFDAVYLVELGQRARKAAERKERDELFKYATEIGAGYGVHLLDCEGFGNWTWCLEAPLCFYNGHVNDYVFIA